MKQSLLRRTAMRAPDLVGSRPALLAAIALTCAWIVWGVFARWSTTWLLWPSAIASVVTFVLVLSLQYTQNRDTRAVHLKLDEILRGTDRARTSLVKLELLSDDELAQLEREIVELREGETRRAS
jgi:low affinity Fe/Cu permease